MTTKTSIRDKVIGTRILAAGISENLTGTTMSATDLDLVNGELNEARRALKRALKIINDCRRLDLLKGV